MKKCTKCSTEKTIENFRENKRYADGRVSWCNDCQRAAVRVCNTRKYHEDIEVSRKVSRDRRSSNIDKYREASKKYYIANREKELCRLKKWDNDNREKRILITVKSRAKYRGLDFNLSVDDIVIPEICPVLGIVLARATDSAKDNSPSIDRIDNTKGYVKGNVLVVSNRANRLKGDATVEEMQAIASFYRALGLKAIT